MSEAFTVRLAPLFLSVLRIMSAALFIAHGTQKLFNFPARPVADGAAPAPLNLFSLIGAAGVLEFAGGLLLLIGLFTRPVAFVLSGMMAVAYFIAHHPRLLSGEQRRRCGDLVLLHLPVPVLRRRRPLGGGRPVRQTPRGSGRRLGGNGAGPRAA